MSKCEACGEVIGVFDSAVAISPSVTVHTTCLQEKLGDKAPAADPAAPASSGVGDDETEQDHLVSEADLQGAPICLALRQVPVFVEYTRD